MSELTLDEAIKHCLEVAEQNEKKAEYRPRMDYYDEMESRTDCLECAADHRQLAEWLAELKEVRRLLRLAVEDMHIDDMCDVCIRRTGMFNNSIKCPDNANCFIWRYKQEAEELLAKGN